MKPDDDRSLELFTISQLMKTENGRAFMWRCLQNCGTFTSTYVDDAMHNAFNSGARSHGLWLDRELREADFNNYLQMLKEHHDG